MTAQKPNSPASPTSDARLRRIFTEFHSAEDSNPPAFDESWNRATKIARTNRRARLFRIAAGLVACSALLAFWWLRDPDRHRPQVADHDISESIQLAESLSRWQGPLDFLLETPGIELLREVPTTSSWLSRPNTQTQIDPKEVSDEPS